MNHEKITLNLRETHTQYIRSEQNLVWLENIVRILSHVIVTPHSIYVTEVWNSALFSIYSLVLFSIDVRDYKYFIFFLWDVTVETVYLFICLFEDVVW